MSSILRYTAFTDDPAAATRRRRARRRGLSDAAMQAIAAEVGYSETAFATGARPAAYDVRYFSPLAEVPFCGHATIATAVALAERDGPGVLSFDTAGR